MIIRDAIADNAAEACEVIRASITELCIADHRHDPDIVARWLASKTPANVAARAASDRSSLLVAVENDAVLAVGGVKDDGEITLNDVAPKARFRGVSAALLKSLEARAVERGAREITLLSTETAHRFYLSRGYRDLGPSPGKFGAAVSYPMRKMLGPEAR
ncbi:MAG TPA: GNAT family N-acetyltransferase [Bradyrhizobium sp.]|uniref:GNAT family N-acetyltransferase n=1 Tax=Bradyrhizobium sp. TaxID=376 RepID=UPI002D805F4F|nr:GNAT family N-acetyltransferase [Bradyrhizobium sp.]HET7889494.1 GNAT family N-acetyltransferase [Bradyrhizobium sp.]